MLFSLILIALVVLSGILINLRRESRQAALEIQERITELQKTVAELSRQVKNSQTSAPAPVSKPTQPPIVAPTPTPSNAPAPAPKAAPAPTLAPAPSGAPSSAPSNPAESWLDRWMQKNPDFEKFVGENLINKIGIAVLVLGIAFFVKYAIDKDWIHEIGRVIIGLLVGSGLVILASRLSKNYRSFSSVLAAGGIAVFYFTITLAFQQYQLFSQTVAFLLMIAITGFAVWLAILYDRLELAIIATVGGFLTPFFVSTGQNNYIALFVYIAILNSGLLALAYFRKWPSVRFIAFLFTLVIFGLWLFDSYQAPVMAFRYALVFATVYYFQFVGMHIIYNLKTSQPFGVVEFFSLLLINLAYYGASMILLNQLGAAEWKGLFTGGIALLNLLAALVFYKQKRIDRRFVLLLLGIAMSFITLAAPVQLNGHYITIFWAAETVLLIWFFFRTQILLIQVASFIVSILCLISLLLDWSFTYDGVSLEAVVVNPACVGTIVVVAATIVSYTLYKKAPVKSSLLTNRYLRGCYSVAAVLLMMAGGSLEIYHQFHSRFPLSGLEAAWIECYLALIVFCLFEWIRWKNIKMPVNVRHLILLAGYLLYLLNTAHIFNLEKKLLAGSFKAGLFSGHWLAALLTLAILLRAVRYIQKNESDTTSKKGVYSWAFGLAIIILFSVEVRNLYVWMAGSPIDYAVNLYAKAGLSIVWGLLSFVFIWIGLKYRLKSLRILALLLFGATLLKLFTYDIVNIPPGGKIVAFILLGILLLIVSFMYQRLKKMLIDDQKEES